MPVPWRYCCRLPQAPNTRGALRALVKKAGRKNTLDAKAERLHTTLRASQMRLLLLVEEAMAGPSFAARGSHSWRRERLALVTLFAIVILYFFTPRPGHEPGLSIRPLQVPDLGSQVQADHPEIPTIEQALASWWRRQGCPPTADWVAALVLPRENLPAGVSAVT